MNASLEGVSLLVSDLEQSIAFYSSIPGAQLEGKREGQFARIRIGDGVVHLLQLPGQTRFHIEFNTENLTETWQHLQTAGLQPARPTKHPWGKSDFRLVDPDGNVLEFGMFEGN
ncbi:MAG: VOC family protein [Anaerolineae bacterium]